MRSEIRHGDNVTTLDDVTERCAKSRFPGTAKPWTMALGPLPYKYTPMLGSVLSLSLSTADLPKLRLFARVDHRFPESLGVGSGPRNPSARQTRWAAFLEEYLQEQG